MLVLSGIRFARLELCVGLGVRGKHLREWIG